MRESVLCVCSMGRKLEWGDRMDRTGESEERESLWWSLIDDPVDFRCREDMCTLSWLSEPVDLRDEMSSFLSALTDTRLCSTITVPRFRFECCERGDEAGETVWGEFLEGEWRDVMVTCDVCVCVGGGELYRK